MAIYHCTTKTVNRSSGRTAVASMAYRAGEKLEDKRTGLTHDFTRKDGVAHTEIVSNLNIEIDRSQLWNLAEQSENRKDARTAREWVIALPDELDADQRKDLAKAFATALVDRYGVIADLAIHEPSKGGNDKNHHAHIMLTTRKAELDADNKLTLTTKTDIELSNAKRKSLGMGTTQDEIKQIRETWANLANRALERAGIQEKIDHRSYADQNNGLQATIHEGTKVTQLRRQGIDTEISRFNDNVKQQNAQQLDQQKQQKESVLQRGLNRVDQGFDQWQKNQETKRLELERQAEMKRQQELDKQRAEQALRKASQKLSRGGMSL
ncbi:MobA/MobL family protein [Acinetobacter towneri]|uniref:MobQ family relaxase n=4 Tax=Acinetobacter towneri TaxID=202956 RepID=UPI001CE059BC|nr:MobQ family relaxase [Acinetobacter towneri]MCA4780609.1 MobA/MobL family protein [Acinetobacter towneri]MCA4785937.1 MobA/MobL family protein [Acinetobacter towneri]MCA4797067.1 MobA/MobL family protein [Acinetobacter towneri]MCA4802158.1 MobA/MobL family protein [Acinetobacter towneri]MCA4804771.1 MobA/MobL family protein [Acinetobacter towneri]